VTGPRYTSDPDAPWCRDCAGTGIRFDAPLWARVMLRQPFTIEAWISPVSGRHRERYIPGVYADTRGGKIDGEHNSFIRWVHRVERWEASAAEVPDWVHAVMENRGALLCMGCHGTGRFRYTARAVA
jgi:hypothetical protein